MSGEESQSSQSQTSSAEANSPDSGSDPEFYVAESLPNTAYDDDPIVEAGEEQQQHEEERDEDGLEPEVLEARLDNRIPVSEW